MTSAELLTAPAAEPAKSTLRIRPLNRRVMHLLRRLHLYFGLFLFPWAILYGFTGYLFNHPRAFSDQPMTAFDGSFWKGTPMESPADLTASARQVVEALNSTASDSHPPLQFVESQPVRYANELAFATLKTSDEDIGLAVAVLGTGGTIRRTRHAPAHNTAEFPWNIGKPVSSSGSAQQAAVESTNRLNLPDSLADRLIRSLPHLQQIEKLPQGVWTVTSVPDLTFVAESNGQRWKVNYNALKGTVSGKPIEAAGTPLSWRRYLTRLHTAHGYPMSSTSAKWFWAIIVDSMAFIMIYWGISGLLMWWQIKATRRWGIAVLSLSAGVAIYLAVGMHGVFTNA